MLAMSALLLTSCQTEEDDVFSQDSSNRMTAYLNEARSVLRSAENGWVMDYYVGDDQVYGGYAFTVKFDSLTCTAMSELTEDKASSSLYKMTTDDGPVLTFDSYNEVMHALATPSTGNYEGYHADFEFVIQSVSPEEIVLKGKKTGNIITMHPLKEPAKDYLAKVKAVEDNMIVTSATGKAGDSEVKASLDLDSRSVSVETATDTISSAFTYTDSGIRLYKPFTVNGSAVSELAYDASSKQFSSSVNGANFVLQGQLPDDYQLFENFAGNYELLYKSENEDGTSETETINVTLTPNADGASYTLSGLSTNWTARMTYNRSKGALVLNSQKVADVDGLALWLCATEGTSLYPGNTNTGVMTQWNKDSEKPFYKLVGNGATINDAVFDADGFCLWLMDGTESAGQFTGRGSANAFSNGAIFIGNFIGLQKK